MISIISAWFWGIFLGLPCVTALTESVNNIWLSGSWSLEISASNKVFLPTRQFIGKLLCILCLVSLLSTTKKLSSTIWLLLLLLRLLLLLLLSSLEKLPGGSSSNPGGWCVLTAVWDPSIQLFSSFLNFLHPSQRRWVLPQKLCLHYPIGVRYFY